MASTIFPHGNPKRKAFTLIELLVVIAIIAMLAAILFPVFSSARDKARSSACLSNTKQLGLAIVQYTQDYDEYFPCGTTQNFVTNKSGGQGWAGQIYPYTKNVNVFYCPSDTYTFPGFLAISYGYNQHLDAGPGTNNPAGIVPLTSIGAPANVVCLFEVTGGWVTMANGGISPTENNSPAQEGYPTVGTNGGATYATGPMEFPPTGSGWQAGRHQNGANYLECDGHAKWEIGSYISNGIDPANATSPSKASGYTAAGSENLTGPNGQVFALTFSNY